MVTGLSPTRSQVQSQDYTNTNHKTIKNEKIPSTDNKAKKVTATNIRNNKTKKDTVTNTSTSQGEKAMAYKLEIKIKGNTCPERAEINNIT